MPDLLIRGAKVWTVDDDLPEAEAVAVRDGRIAGVGDEASCRDLVGSGAEEIDAGGGLVLPGIIDSHNHVRLGSDEGAVQLHGATTLEDVHRRIGLWLDGHPDAEWIEAEGLAYDAIPGGRLPRAEDFDETVTRGLPAIAYTYDVHNAILNRSGLARFGIDAATDRVAFGFVEQDPATGEPTGLIGDFAVMGLERAGQAALAAVLPGLSEERQYARLRHSLDLATGFGITTIVEPQNSLDDLALFERARREGTMRSRVIAALFHPPGTSDDELDAFADAARAFDDDTFRVGPIKLYIDDVIEPHTAAMLEPYAADPTTSGATFYEHDAFGELITKLDARGFQTFTHATGDRGIRTVLDAVEAARTANGPRDARHQIVHVECLHPDDLPRFSELGVVPCMQPRHFAPDIVQNWRDAIGPERWPHAAPWRSLQEHGAVLAFSSDWNVAEMDPLVGIYTAVTRADLQGHDAWTTEQTVDLASAIRAYTMGGAWANHCETDRGSITPGKAADLVVLSEDLFALEPAGILETKVALTIVGGAVVHDAG